MCRCLHPYDKPIHNNHEKTRITFFAVNKLNRV